MVTHEIFMRRCLQLAELGLASVSPNPMVGAVIVYQGQIIGEGWHQQFGKAHAEVNAIEAVLTHMPHGEQLLSKSVLYVSLEPCSHFGKTPPCVDQIIRYQIPTVVIATRDPFSAVQGKGIEKLRNAGIEVIEGILTQEATFLNRRFFTRIQQQRPYIILKWAETANGCFAPHSGQQWITGTQANILNHRWRTEEDAILVGKNTAQIDNPKLNARLWPGKDPIRLVLDRHLVLPRTLNVFDQRQSTIVFTEQEKENEPNIRYVSLENFDFYLAETLAYQLYLFDIQSVIVEGGLKTLQLFLNAGLWDEARVFRSSDAWENGMKAPLIDRLPNQVQRIGPDTLHTYFS